MLKGFLIHNKSGYSKEFSDKYLLFREELFGYSQTYPEIVIDKGFDEETKSKKFQLKNAHLGLLQTYHEAEELLDKLQHSFHKFALEIICIEYPGGDKIQWYTSKDIISSTNSQ